jgi:hypothetical protein
MANDMQAQNKPQTSKSSAALKKKKGVRLPINWFDVFVIAVVVLLVVLALGSTQLVSLLGLGNTAQSYTVEYMVMFSDVDEDLALSISNGAAVYHAASGTAMGQVIADPEVQSHRVLTYADGMAQMKDKPGAVDMIVTVRTVVEYTENEGYSIGGTAVRVGDNLSLRFPGYTGVGHCINISRGSD